MRHAPLCGLCSSQSCTPWAGHVRTALCVRLAAAVVAVHVRRAPSSPLSGGRCWHTSITIRCTRMLYAVPHALTRASVAMRGRPTTSCRSPMCACLSSIHARSGLLDGTAAELARALGRGARAGIYAARLDRRADALQPRLRSALAVRLQCALSLYVDVELYVHARARATVYTTQHATQNTKHSPVAQTQLRLSAPMPLRPLPLRPHRLLGTAHQQPE